MSRVRVAAEERDGESALVLAVDALDALLVLVQVELIFKILIVVVVVLAVDIELVEIERVVAGGRLLQVNVVEESAAWSGRKCQRRPLEPLEKERNARASLLESALLRVAHRVVFVAEAVLRLEVLNVLVVVLVVRLPVDALAVLARTSCARAALALGLGRGAGRLPVAVGRLLDLLGGARARCARRGLCLECELALALALGGAGVSLGSGERGGVRLLGRLATTLWAGAGG